MGGIGLQSARGRNRYVHRPGQGTEIVDLALSDPIYGARSSTRRIHFSCIEDGKFAIDKRIDRPGTDADVPVAFHDGRVADS